MLKNCFHFVVLLLLWALPSFGASVSFQSFDTNYFRTNGLVIRPSPNLITNNQTNVVLSGTFLGTMTNVAATLDGVQLFSQGFANNADFYWLDFYRTNTFGQVLIYQTIIATNNARMTMTNLNRWSLLSLNVIASGSTVMLLLPYPLPHLNTNGFTIYVTNSITNYALFLTNGNEFRLTLQSNYTLSSLWSVFGQ